MKTKFNKGIQPMVFKVALLCSAVASFAAPSTSASDSALLSKQTGLLQKLSDFNSSVMGLSIDGKAKAGIQSSDLSSDQLVSGTPSRETGAFTELDLYFIARPSAETRARVDLRFHQDWQKGHEQGENPLIIHWWSYDGTILDKKLSFNLGDMRVGYTPLTINLPQVKLVQEPQIFMDRRLESMDYRNLDTGSTRLMQGLNADFHSGEWMGLDDIHVQGTLSRLRNNAKKNEQVYFDFDYADRYLAGGRLGMEWQGVTAGINYVNVFDRVKSAHSIDLPVGDTVYYDFNSVVSGEVGVNSEYYVPGPFTVALMGEYAMSNWRLDQEFMVQNNKDRYMVYQGPFINSLGEVDSSLYVVERSGAEGTLSYNRSTESLEDIDGTALALRPSFAWVPEEGDIQVKMNALYLKTDADFQSELAMTPVYMGNKAILNSDAAFDTGLESDLLAHFRSGNLENLYFSIYQSQALTQMNMMGKDLVLFNDLPQSEYYRLFNNYKMSHYYRNSYNNETYKRSEMIYAASELDPSVNMALPFGEATPDRAGFSADLNVAWNQSVTVQGSFGSFKQAEGIEIQYTTMNAGFGVDLDKLLELNRVLDLQASFEKNTADAGYKPETQRIMGGFKVGVVGDLSFLLGYQGLEKTYGVPYMASIKSVKESLLLAGPQVKITAGSSLRLQYGMMSNAVTYLNEEGATKELSIDKSLMTADLSVQF